MPRDSSPAPSSPMMAPPLLRRAVHALEGAEALDAPVKAVRALARGVGGGRAGEALRGQWLGHAAHPLLTDFPLGCWLSAGLLDVFGGRHSRSAATRLVGLGVLAVAPTVATGLAEADDITDARSQRTATAHAVGNAAVAGLYLLSWRARRRGSHAAGVAAGLAGGALAMATGYLGGHLSFARRVGTGERGLEVGTELHLAAGLPGAGTVEGSTLPPPALN